MNKKPLIETLKEFQKQIDIKGNNQLIYLKNHETHDFTKDSKNNLWIDEESHTYYFNDGKDTKINDDLSISATTYIKNYDDRFTFKNVDIPEDKLIKSANDGIKIHYNIEKRNYPSFEKILKDDFNVGSDNLREVILWQKDLKLVGMIDILDLQVLDDKVLIQLIDHKVTKQDKFDYLSLQLNFYRLAIKPLIEFLEKSYNLPSEVRLMGDIIDKYNGVSKRVDIPVIDDENVIEILKIGRKNFNEENGTDL